MRDIQLIEFGGFVYKFVSAGEYWRAATSMTVVEKEFGVIIPRGFITDFRTGPKWLDRWIPKFSMAFVVHDFLYREGMMSRKECDLIQDRLLKTDPQFNWIQRKAIYLAVRIKGKGHYEYYQLGGKFPKP